MTTAYALTDTAPKDAGGGKFMALIDSDTSQGDFALWKGIGASSPGTPARRLAHAAVGTHTQGSQIQTLHPLMMLGGVYIENIGTSPATSPVASGKANYVTMSNWGELHTQPAPKASSHVSTSTNLVKNGSGILYGFYVGWTDANAGDPIRVTDNLTPIFSILTGGSSGFEQIWVDGGVRFTTNLKVVKPNSGGGTASMTVVYR